MNILIIGGTGLIGSASAQELIKRGHQVSTLALPPLPKNAKFPAELKIRFGDMFKLSDKELIKKMHGFDALVFAAGVDERVHFPKPSYDHFKKFNVDILVRLLTLAKACDIRKALICGSYFSYFDKKWPHLKLEQHHPYIRSRREQERRAMAFNDASFSVSVLELPYIFGIQAGREPVWTILAKQISGMKFFTFYPRGGTAMLTLKQTAQAVAGAIENDRGGKTYPVGWFNMNWKEMLSIFHKAMGKANRKVITVPDIFVRMKFKQIQKSLEKQSIEPGLHLPEFTKLMCRELFIDKATIQHELGVQDDDIYAAIADSAMLSLKAIKKDLHLLTMQH